MGIIFNDQVAPGEEFSFTGSVRNEKFSGPNVRVLVSGILNATITSNCPGFSIGQVFGNFTVIAAKSKGGGSLCCPLSIVDKVPPVFQNCPSNISVNLPAGKCKTAGLWKAPTATDDCTLVTITSNYDPEDELARGVTSVTYTAKDAYGNESKCSFNVTVSDLQVPSITGCPSDIRVPANMGCRAIVTWTPPTATDNCSATLSATHQRGSLFSLGKTSVTYTATDPSGNKTTCTFTVIVENGNAPKINECPKDTAVYGDEHGYALVSWKEPKATVACGRLETTKTHSPGSTFSVGKTTVKYDFSDDFGKVSTCEFTVEVIPLETSLNIPQLLTPDGDGVNDRWVIGRIENYTVNSVVVLDRWGHKVFEKNGYDNDNVFWDGTNVHGNVVPTGTYFYSIEIRTGASVIKKTGFVEVIQ